MKAVIYSFILVFIASCGNPVEKMCDVYDNGADDASTASSMKELEEIRADVASGLDDIMFSSGDEVDELLYGKKKDPKLLKRLKDSENGFITAVHNRIMKVYPPLTQLLDVYKNSQDMVEKATDMEEYAAAVQQANKGVQMVNQEYAAELARLSQNDKKLISDAEREFNKASETRLKELSDN